MILIYCAGGNKVFSDIALEYGFRLGARLPGKAVYHNLYFVDQDWKKPDRAAYMRELEKHLPTMATVLDLEHADQVDEVLSWAEEAARFVKQVLIIPKAFGVIGRLPRKIGQADIVLAYSVPTKYGGTFVPVWEFADWPVHLLGGSPHSQAGIARYMNVVSADGNMANLMATRYCRYWVDGTGSDGDRHWQKLEHGFEGCAPGEAFRRSCMNIARFWDDSIRAEGDAK